MKEPGISQLRKGEIWGRQGFSMPEMINIGNIAARFRWAMKSHTCGV